MEKVVGANGKVEEEDRQNLIACAMEILKEESDDEALESIVVLLQDLRMNAAMKEGLQSFRETGWSFIPENGRPSDFELQNAPTSRMLKSEKAKPNWQGRLNYENHPMNNEFILKKIFEFSTVTDLKNCRLVSKKWRNVSLTSWRSKAVLVVENLFEEKIRRYNDYVDAIGSKLAEVVLFENEHKDSTMEEFMKIGSILEIPFKRYNMKFDGLPGLDCCWRFPKNIIFIKRQMMLNLLSTSIEHLSIRCDDLDMMCLLLTRIPELRVLNLYLDCSDLYLEYRSIISGDRECPLRNLKSAISKLCKLDLNVTFCSHNFGMKVNVSFPWSTIFESTPALKSFALGSSTWNTVTNEVLRAVCGVRRKGNFSTLNLEEFRISYHGSIARDVGESRFPLQTLCVDVHDNRNSLSTILDLLGAHAETLECFNAGIYVDDVDMQQQQQPSVLLAPYLPSKVTLPKLKELVLRNDCVWAFHLLSCLNIPNLEKLRISLLKFKCISREERDVVGLILESDEFMGSCFLPNVKEFICDEPVNFCVFELEGLAKSMPNLTDLCIPVGERTFPIVYQLWPGLQSLHLFATRETYLLMDDYALIGFPGKSFGTQARLGSRVPNITDLKNLRKFVVETNRHRVPDFLRPRRVCISDVSAVHGFLQLPKLQILRLETVCKFSPNVMVALENHVLEFKISEPPRF